MSLPVILRPAADADIQTTYDELEHCRAGLGDRFISRVREVLERIEAMPELYGTVWQDVRAARLHDGAWPGPRLARRAGAARFGNDPGADGGLRPPQMPGA